MMTDKLKEEFVANSSWLKLSFHANDPNDVKPYINTDMTTISREAEMIYREIIRFAGEETLSIHNTTLRYCECTPDGMRAMNNLGLRGLYAYFDMDSEGEPMVSYYYTKALVEHIHNRDFWFDNEQGVLFGKIDLVLNSYPLDEIILRLERVKSNLHTGGCVDIMIHEQYFYEDFELYIPEFKEIVFTACKWCKDNGYKGYYMNEIME